MQDSPGLEDTLAFQLRPMSGECGIRKIFACEICNLGLWNPEYSSRNPESH